jgi:Cofactor assembly of complex C subunit B, CCB2/CCB4
MICDVTAETNSALYFTLIQSILVQPLGSEGLMILGADRPRPFTGQDFGWLQAVCDRLTGVLASTSDLEG